MAKTINDVNKGLNDLLTEGIQEQIENHTHTSDQIVCNGGDTLSTELSEAFDWLESIRDDVDEINQNLITAEDVADGSDITIVEKNYGAEIGTLSSLQTSNKGNLVAAINEVFQSGNNVKQQLVDTLSAKGVNCSTSDSWDTLINYINNTSSSGIELITATSLPATGKEGQLCVITNTSSSSYLISSDESDVKVNDSVIRILTSTNTLCEKYTYTANNSTISFRISQALQNNVAVPLYVYTNNAWKQIGFTSIFALKNCVVQSGFSIGSTGSNAYYNSSKGLVLVPGANSYLTQFQPFGHTVDFSKYKAVRVKGTYRNAAVGSSYGSSIGIFSKNTRYSDGCSIGIGYGPELITNNGAYFKAVYNLPTESSSTLTFDTTFQISDTRTGYFGVFSCSVLEVNFNHIEFVLK